MTGERNAHARVRVTTLIISLEGPAAWLSGQFRREFCQRCALPNKDFTTKYPAIVSALARLPDETVIDGEVVALDDSGWRSFSALQDYASSKVPIVYYVFDALMIAGRNVMSEPASVRRHLLRREILPKLGEPIRESPVMGASLPDLINAVRAHGFEGLVAKRLDSKYEPGQRSGAWSKMRIAKGRSFVISGYTPSAPEL